MEKIDEKIKQLIIDMEKTLSAQKDPKGVGLAANQLGENLSLFIIKASERAKIKAFINPRIISRTVLGTKDSPYKKQKKKRRQSVKLEGCLSIPRIWGSVNRAKKILLEYQDLTPGVRKKSFQGFEATIIQHEIDHLNGIVFTQRSLEQKQPVYKEEGEELVKVDLS
ncbi:MAG: Peptide deformylase [Candidatus Roizmanbacteria bacterium GW2011_GWC2_37_13]|uniref:Peptide deformylase n=1 Tax=Candidatus Roizmanbacteria bacterium GW2011_GWC2_37_13 TaxID=1618486 RepID=A0A0G0G4D1_9BACT|nr:MAG: peptide deformylase [Candidatus Roizmanbacteria bacterium GW2011_GWC1_37_12]KKQ25983.1 MAG: Peptide deformylase [Candidatus Roizmanbacteria bacterium GW2011_GWC2_37_13]